MNLKGQKEKDFLDILIFDFNEDDRKIDDLFGGMNPLI